MKRKTVKIIFKPPLPIVKFSGLTIERAVFDGFKIIICSLFEKYSLKGIIRFLPYGV